MRKHFRHFAHVLACLATVQTTCAALKHFRADKEDFEEAKSPTVRLEGRERKEKENFQENAFPALPINGPVAVNGHEDKESLLFKGLEAISFPFQIFVLV